jgi:hypothetical protein
MKNALMISSANRLLPTACGRTQPRLQRTELTSLRFMADAYNVLIMGPVGGGKRLWPTR